MIYFELGMTEDGKPQVLNAGASDRLQFFDFCFETPGVQAQAPGAVRGPDVPRAEAMLTLQP